MEEAWMAVKGAKGLYEVSDAGRVRSLDRISNNKHGPYLKKGRVLRPTLNASGYPIVCLHIGDVQVTAKVHRLVAFAFLSRPFGLAEVNHKDGDKTNNRVDNLEWVSHHGNMLHAYDKKLLKLPKREHVNKLTPQQVSEIRAACVAKIPQKETAAKYGITQAYVSAIATGRRWAVLS